MDLELFLLSQNQYSYLSFQSFKGTLKMLQITLCPQIQQEKSLKWPESEALGLCSWNFGNFLFSLRLSNGEYFNDFKIFDLTWICWIWLEWPKVYLKWLSLETNHKLKLLANKYYCSNGIKNLIFSCYCQLNLQ